MRNTYRNQWTEAFLSVLAFYLIMAASCVITQQVALLIKRVVNGE